MTGTEFSTTLIRARRWAGVAYFVSAVTLMCLICGVAYIWFPEIRKLALVFRDHGKAIGDDGTYGAIVGLLISTFLVIPSMVLPLWFVVIVDRRLGTSCSACGSSLTLWKRGSIVLRTGNCAKCSAVVVESASDTSEDESGKGHPCG